MDQTQEAAQGQYDPYRKKDLPKGYTPHRENGEYYDGQYATPYRDNEKYYNGEYQFDVYDNYNPIKKSRFDRFRSWFGDMGRDLKQ